MNDLATPKLYVPPGCFDCHWQERLVKRWLYIDMRKALNSEADPESTNFVLPEDRSLKKNNQQGHLRR